jgi:hypothetical protein
MARRARRARQLRETSDTILVASVFVDVGWTESKSVMNAKTIAVAGAVAATIALVGGAAGSETVAAIRTTNQARARYLAHAIIWHSPPDLSPADLVEGPAGVFPYTRKQATGDEAIPCTFARAGRELGGNSAKFLCRTADGRDLRLKYWDPRGIRDRRRVTLDLGAGLQRYSRNVDQRQL